MHERKVMAICDTLYQKLVPPEVVAEQLIDDTTPMDKFRFVHQYCLNLLGQLDEIPVALLKSSERTTREKRKLRRDQSTKAVIEQNRFELWKKQIKHQFAPAAEFRRVMLLPFWKKNPRKSSGQMSLPH